MAAALRNAGVSAGDAAYLVATAHPESGGCSVEQQGEPYAETGWGVWQITPGNSEAQFGTNSQLFNLQANANAAAAKLKSQGLDAWTTITSGKYLTYLSSAKSAVTTVYNMSEAEVNKLVNSAGTSGPATAQTTSFLSSALDPFEDIGSDIVNGLAISLGAKSVKDGAIRLGLILLGAAIVIVGLIVLAGRAATSTAITVAAPESRVAQVPSGATTKGS
jgi:hypothetical protein